MARAAAPALPLSHWSPPPSALALNKDTHIYIFVMHIYVIYYIYVTMCLIHIYICFRMLKLPRGPFGISPWVHDYGASSMQAD